MKTLLKIVIILTVVAALALLGIKAIKHKRAQEARTPTPPIYPVVVKHMRPHLAEVRLTLPYLAEATNESDVTLSSRIAARIVTIVPSGTAVHRGDTVATLDTTDIEAQLRAVRTALKNATATYKRTQALYKVQGASVEQLQNEQAKIAELKAKTATLQNQLNYAKLVSPVEGIVTKTTAAVGDIAMPGKPLMRIAAKQGFSLLVRTPSDIDPIAVIYDDKRYALHRLASTFHGLKEYKASIDTDQNLAAGERVETDVVIYEGEGILLPFDALLERNGHSDVLIVQNRRAVAHPVEIIQRGQEGVVVKGIPPKADIVVAKPDILLKLLGGYPLTIKE